MRLYDKFFSILLLLPFSALAQSGGTANNVDNSPGAVERGFNKAISTIDGLTTTAIGVADFTSFTNTVYTAFAVWLIVKVGLRYVYQKADLYDFLAAFIALAMVRTIMLNYPFLINVGWEIATGVSGVLQKAMVGNDDLFFAPKFLSSVAYSVTFSGNGWTAPFAALRAALIVVLASIPLLIMSVLAYITAIWGFWGWQLGKLVGLMFIPTMLSDRLNWLMDGWLRFMAGYIVFYIIARMNLVFCAVSVALFLGVGLPPSPQATPIYLNDMESFFEMFGLLTFMLVGILALFATGKFASSLVSGAGGGGIGGSVLAIARIASKF